MADNSMKITYKIYMEAEDVSSSRILSSTAFVKNLLKNCGNSYFWNVKIDDESDLEDFTLRLYVENEIEEEVCSFVEDRDNFIGDMAEILDRIAQAQSYMDMEGSFSAEWDGKKEAYAFTCEAGMDYCDFKEQ